MPYIKKEDRKRIEVLSVDQPHEVVGIYTYDIQTAGELQYAMAVMFKSYIARKGLRYQNCNDVMGALAGAQMEFYRKTVVPYEDVKIKENGDV